MSSRYAPGRDRVGPSPLYSPSAGSGGAFAEWIQGATPKYAKNRGFRSDLYRDTLSRLFVRVEERELTTLFAPSIADEHVRTQLLSRIAGDPSGARGYIDYFIQQMSIACSEKTQIVETLADDYVLYTFGQVPIVATVQGALLNTVQDDQATNFLRLYLEVLRASKLALREKAASLKVDSYIFTGVMLDLNMSLASTMEVLVPFSFRFLIKKLAIVNYTSGWQPTGVGTPFATDLNAVPADVRLQTARPSVAVTFHAPPDADETHPQEDPRVREVVDMDFTEEVDAQIEAGMVDAAIAQGTADGAQALTDAAQMNEDRSRLLGSSSVIVRARRQTTIEAIMTGSPETQAPPIRGPQP